jgi:hypothetical protein
VWRKLAIAEGGYTDRYRLSEALELGQATY